MATIVEATPKQPVQAATPERAPWYKDRTRQAVMGVAALAVAAGGAWLVTSGGQRKEAFAARSLATARSAAESGNLPLASSELQKVIATYKGTDAAQEAAIALNQVRMINGQNELAVVGLRDFLKTDPKPDARASAEGLLGAALENGGKPAEAAEAYSRAADAATQAFVKSEMLVDAGRAFRAAGKNDDAVRVYRTVIEKYEKTPAFTEAQVRLAELTKGKL
jgi:TolA-binding protein